MYKKEIFLDKHFKFVFILMIMVFLLFSKSSVFALKDNEFFERNIRGTDIIHVVFNKDANSSNILNHIQKNINPSYSRIVSSTPSYNSEKNSSINWYIKNDDSELMGVYFDGGTRDGRDNNYEFIDLRWLGNGSPHMYFFWKFDIEDKSPIGKRYLYHGLQQFSKQMEKNIIEKISNKIIKELIDSSSNKFPLPLKFVSKSLSVVTAKEIVKKISDLIENDSDALRKVVNFITPIEDAIMGITDFVDDVPVARNIARGGLECWKTIGKATDYPVNVFKNTLKEVTETNFKEIENPLDLVENSARFAGSISVGVYKATFQTISDISYGIKDTFNKLLSW